MELPEVVKGDHYLARESRAEDFRGGFETSVCCHPFSRRVIDYKVVVRNGRRYWKEIGRREFVHEQSPFFGKWHWGWYHTDEELIAMTRIGSSP